MALRHQLCGGFAQINLSPNTIGIRTLSAMQSPTQLDSNPEAAAKAALFCEGIFLDRVDTTIWISAEEAAKKLDVSPAEIQKQLVPWQESPERCRIRYKLALDAGDVVQRYYRPDVEAGPSGTKAAAPPIGRESDPPRPTQKNSVCAMSTDVPEIPKPASKIWERVAPGIYRYLKSQTFYERPWINGRRTYRSLGTTDLQTAKCEFRRRRGLSPEPARDRPSVRAILEFNLPEAQESFEASVKGLEWKTVVLDLDHQLHSWIKERQHFVPPAKAFRVLRQQLHQRLAENGLGLV
jgi:hypothetical protein